MLALNEKEYSLEPFMTVIADDRQVHDIGGIMGGEDSGVSEATTDVMLEVAYFTPEQIARTGQALGLTSDARSRFERGVDPAFLDDGLAILTGLIVDICGGEPSALIRAGEPPIERRTITFDFGRTKALSGIDVPERRQREILERLGFEFDGANVTVPTWRRDVEGPADLVEEVARIEGYDKVPSTPLTRAPGVAKPTATRSQLMERRARRTAAARGLDEAMTWSFISEEEADAFGGADWRLANPISEDMKVMRPSLLPGLIAAARRNLDRGASSVRLFEVGRRYLGDAEHPTLSLVLAGERHAREWQSGKAQSFEAIRCEGGSQLALLDAAGAPVANLQVFPNAGPTWHPGRSARLGLGPKTIVASFGELHPGLQKDAGRARRRGRRRNLSRRDPGAALGGVRALAYAPPALQPIARDFAFIVPDDLPAENLLRAIRGARQSGHHRRPAVRPVRGSRRPVARLRSDAAARSRRASPTSRSARFRDGSSLRRRS